MTTNTATRTPGTATPEQVRTYVLEQLAVIATEADELADDVSARHAAATINQAAGQLLQVLDQKGTACAKITRVNGSLRPAYAPALHRVTNRAPMGRDGLAAVLRQLAREPEFVGALADAMATAQAGQGVGR